VLNVGSVDAIRVPEMENYSYSASNAAVHMLTRHLAKRLAPEHITVNAIAPGPFETKMLAFVLRSEEERAAVASSVPVARIGSPEDLVGTTTFLCSRAGSYLTGALIPLDGGIGGCG
jgi:NAD(P)-dependent dehydrogenase (short-subunit alcohol dehydrogenase family)